MTIKEFLKSEVEKAQGLVKYSENDLKERKEKLFMLERLLEQESEK